MKYIFFSVLLFSVCLNAQVETSIQKQWDIASDLHLSGEREQTIAVYQQIIDSIISVAPKHRNDKELATTYNKLGVHLQNYGRWDESTLAYTKGLLVLEENDYLDSLKADLNLNLGLIFVKLGSSDRDYYLDLAESLALKSNNHRVLFVIYKIRRQFNKGIQFAKEISNDAYLANYYYYKAIGDSTTIYFDSARMVMPILPDALLQNFQYHAFITEYFLEQNQMDSALSHTQLAEEIAPLLNDEEVEIHYLGNYADVYLKMEDYKKAYLYMYKADSVRLKLV